VSDHDGQLLPPENSGRWLLAWVLAALLVVVTAVAVAGAWAHSVLFDTDRYVATVAPLSDDPAIQDALTEQLTAQAVTTIEAEIEQLPAFVQGPLLTLAGRLEDVIAGALGDIVRSDQFGDAWVAANRAAHPQLVAALTGESPAVELAGNLVSVQAQALADVAEAGLEAAGLAALAELVPAVEGSFVVLATDTLPLVQAVLRMLEAVGAWLWLIAVVLAGGVVAAAPRRLRGAVLAAGSVATGAAVLALGLGVVRTLYLESTGVLPVDAKAALFDRLVSQLWPAALIVLAVGVTAAVVLGLVEIGRARRAGAAAR
jgi:hypothetical protein